VGNPGNTADPPPPGYGAVSYSYEIGTYDVTLNQFVAFLNSVARQNDIYKVYNSSLAYTNTTSWSTTWNLAHGGILQIGTPGKYTYVVKGDGRDPVTFVNWLTAARFCNWVQNGEPENLGEVPGSTETGAYTLFGDTTIGVEIRNPGATWWIPSENEWYKAAYYDPNYGGPNVGGYWKFATQSNTAPGNDYKTPAVPNQANYYSGVYSLTQSSTYDVITDYLTPVRAFINSPSYYGTYDQAGDVYNWNDAYIISNSTSTSASRGIRGGCWVTGTATLASSSRGNSAPAGGSAASNTIGFRIATTYAPANGRFEGLSASDSGIISLTIKNADSFTGAMIYSGTLCAIRGVFTSGTFSGSFSKARVPVSITLAEVNPGDIGNYILTGSLGTQPFKAYHSSYGYARAAAEKGTYSISLSGTDVSPMIPQFSGSATLTVGATGGVLMGGILPDGEHFRAAGIMIMGPGENQVLVYDSLIYPAVATRAARGLLTGNLTFSTDAAGGFTVGGALDWTKPTQTKGFYRAIIHETLDVKELSGP
jgi:formylglycine-generating enzyme required for sulfatase activity